VHRTFVYDVHVSRYLMVSIDEAMYHLNLKGHYLPKS
jgi:hypothetical protein